MSKKKRIGEQTHQRHEKLNGIIWLDLRFTTGLDNFLHFGIGLTHCQKYLGFALLLKGSDFLKTNFVFRILNEVKHVHSLVIELEHPSFHFERSDIELQT